MFSSVVASVTTQTYASLFFVFCFFLLEGKHNPLVSGNWTGGFVFQSGVCLLAMSSKNRRLVLTAHDIFGQNYESLSMDHRSDSFFFL